MGTFNRVALVTGLGASLVVTTVGAAYGPPVLTFGVAAAAAACWCVWLDHHPDA